jgi:hypothetical protein
MSKKYTVEYVNSPDEKGVQNVKLSSPKGDFSAYLKGDVLDFKTHKGKEFDFELEWHKAKNTGNVYATGNIVQGQAGGGSPVSGDVQERIAFGQAVNCSVSMLCGPGGKDDFSSLSELVDDFYTLLTKREFAEWMGGASDVAGNADDTPEFPDDDVPF